MVAPMRPANTLNFKPAAKPGKPTRRENYTGREDRDRNSAISRRQANLGGYGQRGQIANPNDPNRRRFDVLSKLDDENWQNWNSKKDGETFQTKYVTGGRMDGFQPSDFGEGHRGAGIPWQVKQFDAVKGEPFNKTPMLPAHPKGVDLPKNWLDAIIRRSING